MFVILDLSLIQWLIFRVHTTLAVGIYFLSGSTYFYFVYMDSSYFLFMHHNDKLHYYNAALFFLCSCILFLLLLSLFTPLVIQILVGSMASPTRWVRSGVGNSATV